MCNLYSITTPVVQMHRLFDVCENNDQLGNFKPLDAAFPKYQAPVVRIGGAGERQLVSMEWGFATPKYQKGQVNRFHLMLGTTRAIVIFLNRYYGGAALKPVAV